MIVPLLVVKKETKFYTKHTFFQATSENDMIPPSQFQHTKGTAMPLLDSFTVDGALEYVELAPQLNLPPQEEDAAFHTVAGLIMEELENLPEIGESVDFHGWRFEVLEKAGQRIERVKISKIPEEE